MAEASVETMGRLAHWRAYCVNCIFGGNQQATKNREIICHMLSASVGIFIMFPLLYMLLDRGPVLEIRNPRIEPMSVERGTKMRLMWDATEYRNCDGMVQRWIVDSAGHVFSFTNVATVYHEALQASPTRTFSRELTVPRGAAIGPALYRSRVTRWCNVAQQYLWPIRESPPDVQFHIMDRSQR